MRFVPNLKVFMTGSATHDWRVNDFMGKLHGMHVGISVHDLTELDLKITFLSIRS